MSIAGNLEHAPSAIWDRLGNASGPVVAADNLKHMLLHKPAWGPNGQRQLVDAARVQMVGQEHANRGQLAGQKWQAGQLGVTLT